MTGPWAQQLPELSLEQIRRACERIPGPSHDLARLDPHSAVKALDDLLSGTFVVTTAVARTLGSLYHKARAGLHMRYQSDRQFYSALDKRRFPEATAPAICFTGLAGVGKSTLLRALGCLLKYPMPVFEPMTGVQIDLKAYLYVPAKGARSPNAFFERIYSHLISDGTELTRLKGAAGPDTVTEAFRRGLVLIGLDELQHLTLSNNASALFTGVLLSIFDSGIPFIYGCNYSLVHRLLRRNHEDHDRLLRAIVEQRPEDWNSAEWLRVVHVMLGVAPDAFKMTADSCAELLGKSTLCLPRALRDLLWISYLRARGAGRFSVTTDDMRSAYKSIEFSSMRNNIESIRKYRLTGTIEREDIALPPRLAARVDDLAPKDRQLQLEELRSTSILEGSLTIPERKGLKLAASGAKPQHQTAKSMPSDDGAPSPEDQLRKGLEYIKRKRH